MYQTKNGWLHVFNLHLPPLIKGMVHFQGGYVKMYSNFMGIQREGNVGVNQNMEIPGEGLKINGKS